MTTRNVFPLLLGAAMVMLGALFLAINLGRVQPAWFDLLRLLIPVLLLAWGLTKMVRYYLWSHERLARQPGKGSLLGGFFWTTVGGLSTLQVLGLLNGFGVFATYWPLILVVFGIGKVLDHYLAEGRVSFRATEIVGVILIILVGLLSGLALDLRTKLAAVSLPAVLRDQGILLEDFVGSRFTFETEDRILVEGLQGILVSNLHGNVRVEAGTSDEVEVRLQKVVFESSEEAARRFSERIRVEQSREGERLLLAVNRDELTESRVRFLTHWTVRVPEDWDINVSNGFGDLVVRRIRGRFTLENDNGEVEVEDLEGDLSIQNRFRTVSGRRLQGRVVVENHRGSVLLDDVAGDVEARTEFETIRLRKVRGDATASTRFGDLLIEEVSGKVQVVGPGTRLRISRVEDDVRIEQSHKDATISNLSGSLEMDGSFSRIRVTDVKGPVILRANHCSIRGERLTGGVTVQGRGSEVDLTRPGGVVRVATSLRRVRIQEFRHEVDVQNEFAAVELATSEIPVGNVTVTNRNGEISLRLPADAAFRLSAAAPGGRIRSDFAETRVGDLQVLEEEVGSNGLEVRLQTTFDRIRIYKGARSRAVGSGDRRQL